MHLIRFKSLIFFLLLSFVFLNQTHAFKNGDRVKCQYRGIGSYYNGTVTAADRDSVHITYDDGEKQKVPRNACRLLTESEISKVKKKADRKSGSGNLIKIVSNTSSGWDNWTLFFGNMKGSIHAKNNGYLWHINADRARVSIDPCIGGREKWMKWKYYYNGNQIIVEAKNRDNWVIDGNYTRLKVRTRWSKNFSHWEVSGKKGSMKVWSKGSSWKSWIIQDNMAAENIHLKIAALFAIIYASDVMK